MANQFENDEFVQLAIKARSRNKTNNDFPSYEEFKKSYGIGGGASDAPEKQGNDTVGNGFFGHLKDAADAGFYGSLAGTARFMGEFSPFDGETMNGAADWLDEQAKFNTANPQDLTGSNYIASAVGNAIGSGAAGLLDGAVLMGIASATGAAFPAANAVAIYKAMRARPILSTMAKATHKMWKSPYGKLLMAEVASSPLEATAEAGNLITEMRNEGYTDEEIRTAALKSAGLNAGWLTLANMIGGHLTAKYGKEAVKDGLKGFFKNASKGAAIEGSQEAVQEYGQSLIGNVAEGTELDHEAAKEAAAQAFVGSGILGGIGGAAAPYINNNPAKASQAQVTDGQAVVEGEDVGNEPSVETDTTITPEVEQARNEIIGYRETLDEDDAEVGRLTELLDNGNDEEIIAEAQAIRGVKPESEEEAPTISEETTSEAEKVESEVIGDVVDTTTLETPAPKQEENGGKADGETNISPQGETPKSPENTGDNGEPQEDGSASSQNQQESEEIKEEDLPPTFLDAADGLLVDKPKSKFQQAQERIKTIKNTERQKRFEEDKQKTSSVANGVVADDYGYKTSLGEYSTVDGIWNKEDYHRYENKDNKTIKALHKNTDDTYMVESIVEDADGNKKTNYATFSDLKEAEDFVATGKAKRKIKLKTYWASVRDSKNKIKIIKMAYPTKSAFQKALKDGGYRVRVVATPDKFEEEVGKFNNRVEVYNAGRKAKKEAEKNLKANLTVIEAEDKVKEIKADEKKKRLKTFDSLVSMLRKSGIKVYTAPEDLAKAAQSGHNGVEGKIEIDNNQVYIVNGDGKRYMVNGLADRKKGIIYLNRFNVRLDVPIHEYTHIWSQILRETNPELWQRGIELMKETSKWEELKNSDAYRLSSDDEIADEVLSWLSGNHSVDVFEELSNNGTNKTIVTKLRKWLKEFWAELKSFFEVHGAENVKELSLEEFINMPLKDFAEGKTIVELRSRANAASTAKTIFDKYSPDRNKSFYEQKLDAYLKTATQTVKEAFKNEKIKKRTIEVAELNPKLYVNKSGEEIYYYVSYDNSKGTKKIPASIFKALRVIVNIEPQPYKVKSDAVKEGMSPQQSILADDGVKDFAKQIASAKKKFANKEEQIETLLGLTNEDSDKTIAEQVREAAAKDLPAVGKENEEDAFMDLDFEWADNDFVDELAYDYYDYLIKKYQTKTGDLSAMLVPVVENQTRSKKIQELEKRLASGENRLAIWKETGWYKAKDGRWKYFIDDDLDAIDLSKVTTEDGDIAPNSEITLGELYDNPILLKQFPYLADVKIKFVRLLGSSGVLKDGVISIKANRTIPAERIKRTLLHELQHIIQEKEGMAVGTSPKDISISYSKTVDAYWNEAGKIGKKAQTCLTKYSEWVGYDVNPFGTKASKQEKIDSKADYIKAKESFEAVASAKNKKLLKELLRKIKILAEQTKESLKNKSKGENGFNQAYLDALGEEEARMVQYNANASLSEKDQKIKTELEDMLGEMVDEEAELATHYLYGSGRAIAGDVEMSNAEKQELDAFGEELSMFGWDSFVNLFNSSDDKKAVADSLAHLYFIMGHDNRSIVFLGDGGKVLSVEAADASPQDSLLARGTKAVVTKKPQSVIDDVKNEGWRGWAKHMFRKFYRNWIDKNIDIKDLDVAVEGVVGRAVTDDESIYNRVQMIGSNAAGLTHTLINGDEKHVKAINTRLNRKQMKYKVTLAAVLDMVNDNIMKPYEDYLKASGCNNWVEAFGAYLGWRRLKEMARLHREAFAQEHAEWAARKRAYDAWANSGRIGKNPLLADYEAWEAYQKNLKNAKRRWEYHGKIGPDPTIAMREEWLAAHKDEEAPKRYVGKEPVFEQYKMPQNLSEKDVDQLIKQAPEPFAKAAKYYYKLNDNILSVMEDAGLIDAKTHELLNEKYKDYCPMIRDFSDTAAVDAFIESITTGGNGVANVSSTLKKIREEGSERTIINPLESTIQTIAAVSNRAERNKAGQHLVRMMGKAEELKGLIRKLEQPKHGTIQADPKNCIFTVMFNGKKVAYQSAPEYYQAIVGYNLPTASLLLRVPQTAAKFLRTGATMSPSFIVRNILRDTVTAGIASQNGFIPIVDTIKGAMALWNDKKFRAEFEASGIVNFNQFGSAESAYNNLTDLASGKNYTIYEPKEIIKGVFQAVLKGKGIEALKTTGISLEQLSSFVESATRAGEYKKALEKGKDSQEASRDAKEVTLDFSRSGILGQRANQVIPFFNACIQGGDKMGRLLYENPKGTILKIAQYIMLPSLALWLMNHDEDWYEELDPQIKYSHWCLPNGIRIPKPQEYGILFGGSIEAMLDNAVENDPKAMEEWAKGARDVMAPSVLPTIILPLIEWQTNYSFFKGRDLVPQRLQRMPDELQYSTGTSELSKFIGKNTYVSPIKVDNLIRGYTGTMGMFLWQTPDWFAAEKQGLPAKEISEMQFIRDFNVTAANRTRYINDFYELQQKANQQQAGYGIKGKPSVAIKAIRRAGKIINDLNKQIRAIEVSEKYSPERKRELIDKKKERINATAKLAVTKYGKDFL